MVPYNFIKKSAIYQLFRRIIQEIQAYYQHNYQIQGIHWIIFHKSS